MFLELPEVAQPWPFSTNWITILASTISEKVVTLNLLSSVLTRTLRFEHLTCQGGYLLTILQRLIEMM